jgi:hypothetical protein
MSQIKVIDTIKHTFYIQQIFSRKSFCLWNNVEVYGGAKKAAENMAPARGMFDN